MGDTATLFQDAAGATPVTAVTQPIGMVLDKSQGLVIGSEMVTNGDFSNGTTGWTALSSTLSVDTGRLKILAASTYGWAYQAFTTVVGRTYRLTYSLTNGDASACYLYIDTGTGLSSANYDSGVKADGTYTAVFVATATTTFVKPLISGNGKFAFYDNISIKELPGNHATQPTAGWRPLYQVVSGYGCAQFDGANDILQVTGINLSATDKVLIGLAFKPNTTALTVAMEYSPTAVSSPGAFYVSLNESGTGKHNMLANNGGGGLDVVTLSSAVALAPTVLIDYIDLAQLASIAKHSVRVNGASAGITSIIDGPDVAGNFGNYDLFLGARSGGSAPSNMDLYRAFVLAGSSTAGEQLILENWLRESCGV